MYNILHGNASCFVGFCVVTQFYKTGAFPSLFFSQDKAFSAVKVLRNLSLCYFPKAGSSLARSYLLPECEKAASAHMYAFRVPGEATVGW